MHRSTADRRAKIVLEAGGVEAVGGKQLGESPEAAGVQRPQHCPQAEDDDPAVKQVRQSGHLQTSPSAARSSWDILSPSSRKGWINLKPADAPTGLR
jgi:hypothetical protein